MTTEILLQPYEAEAPVGPEQAEIDKTFGDIVDRLEGVGPETVKELDGQSMGRKPLMIGDKIVGQS